MQRIIVLELESVKSYIMNWQPAQEKKLSDPPNLTVESHTPQNLVRQANPNKIKMTANSGKQEDKINSILCLESGSKNCKALTREIDKYIRDLTANNLITLIQFK